jgi:predicted nucleic acid-binding protein
VILDTNVLLRALDGDPGAQGQAARARIAQAREDGRQLTVLAATVLEVERTPFMGPPAVRAGGW